jgi:myo-inositol 2-dehydrogenase/D-chiro-inositol 1-dehydrogenase
VTVNIGVIGTGNIGTDHISKLSGRIAGARVSAVFDVDTERASAVAQGVGAKAHGSALEVIESPDTDAVVIASPGPLHPEQTLACLAAGKPVLCEKPLGTTSEECRSVLDAEVEVGRRLVQVGFMRRYDPAYREVKAAVDTGRIGEPLMVHAIHRNPVVPDAFTAEMSMTDSVVHEFDTFRWLLGTEIAAVTVLAGKRSPRAAQQMRDPQLVLMEMADGVLVEVESFVNCQYGYDVRCEVVGSEGTVTLENPRASGLLLNGLHGEGVPADWRVRFTQAYHDELQEWVDGLASGTVSGPSSWDGYAATAVSEASVRALATGGRVEVALGERPALYVEPGAQAAAQPVTAAATVPAAGGPAAGSATGPAASGAAS